MADPIGRGDLQHNMQLAAISQSGIRPLANATLTITTLAEDTYTIQDIRTLRVLVFHPASNDDEDIRFDVNATADGTSFPIAAGTYFSVEVQKDDVIHLFNTTGVTKTVYLLEIR